MLILILALILLIHPESWPTSHLMQLIIIITTPLPPSPKPSSALFSPSLLIIIFFIICHPLLYSLPPHPHYFQFLLVHFLRPPPTPYLLTVCLGSSVRLLTRIGCYYWSTAIWHQNIYLCTPAPCPLVAITGWSARGVGLVFGDQQFAGNGGEKG